MARPKKEITPVEVIPDFSISLSKKGMSISMSKVGDKLSVNSTPLSGVKNFLDLIVYRELLDSAIEQYLVCTDDEDDDPKKCVNPEEDLKPCYCH